MLHSQAGALQEGLPANISKTDPPLLWPDQLELPALEQQTELLV